MKRLVVLVATLGFASCQGPGIGHSASPDGRDFHHTTDAIDRHAPTLDAVGELEFEGLASGRVRLKGGTGAAGAVTLRQSFALAGDITGNGTDETVVLLDERREGAPPRTYVAIVTSMGGSVHSLATAEVPDRATVTGGRVEHGRVTLSVEGPAPLGAGNLQYVLERSRLRLAADTRQPTA